MSAAIDQQSLDDYEAFLARNQDHGADYGFDPIEIPDVAFPFQAFSSDWTIRRGRSELIAGCGLGKSLMEYIWCDNVVRHTNKPVLLLTPLSVGSQMVREGEKFGYESEQSRNGKFKSKIVVTNYEKLHLFNPSDFAGLCGDEASAIKNCDGKTRAAVTEFCRTLPYRLLCTATAAPE